MSGIRQRRRALEVGVGVLLLVLALAVVLGNATRPAKSSTVNPKPSPSPTTTLPAKPTQSTVLIELRADDNTAAGSILTGVGGSVDRSVWLSVDPRLLVEVSGLGTSTLAQAVSDPSLNVAQSALSDVAGVRIDGSWRLGRLAFAGLVDAVGGVTVAVPTAVTLGSSSGTAKLVLPAGIDHLQGDAAARYVIALSPGEPQAVRTARMVTVLQQLVMSLPIEAARIRAILGSLGATSESTASTEVLAAYLAHTRSNLVSGNSTFDAIPTLPVIGSKPVAVRIDAGRSTKLFAATLPLAVRTPGETSPVRVLVQYGAATPGLPSGVADRLASAGLAYINGAAASGIGFAASQVLVPDDSAAARGWGDAVTKALGLPAWDVRSVGHPIVGGDVQVILGSDYHP